MTWLQRVSPTADRQLLLDAAEQAFHAICQGDTAAADFYRVHPDLREQDWRAIRADLLESDAAAPAPRPSQGLRVRLATAVGLLVADHFYAALGPADRASYAGSLGTDREAMDAALDARTTLHFAQASVLEFLTLDGEAGEEMAVDDLARLQREFIEACHARCELELRLVRLRHLDQLPMQMQEDDLRAALLRHEAAWRAFIGEVTGPA